MSTPTTVELTRTPHQKLVHMAEECTELVLAICKAQRFGMNPTSLGITYDNMADIEKEMNDVIYAVERFKRYIAKSTPEQRRADFIGLPY